MVEIADTAEVSRATLYNHFRDKSSVMRALLESEVDRILLLAQGDSLPHEVLARISIEISTDPALSMIRTTDPAMLISILTHVDDPLWVQIRTGLSMVVGEESLVELSRLWLVGQITQPLTAEESHIHARAIASLIRSS
jgi:AcrR family transcriptional regulator